MFNPWLAFESKIVGAIAENILSAYEHQPRERAMKARDRENLRAILRTLLANIAYAVAVGADPPHIGISLRTAKVKLTRYDRRGFTGLPAILRRLEAAGSIKLRTSDRKGIASTIVLDSTWIETFRHLRFTGRELHETNEDRETIYLGSTERDYVEGTVRREPIDYADTPETERYRAEMATINAFLAKTDLRMEPDGGPALITTVHHHLRRYFNVPPGEQGQRFDLGGRLFGGWWQDLPRARRSAIRIKGEPIADLDFGSMFLRLAYREAGIAPPDGDLYAAVPGLSDPRWRDGVKKMVSAMLFRSSPLKKVPRDLKDELPPRISGARIRSAILAAHPALAPVFETGLGLRLMFTESQILVASLLRLIDQRIPALPMHDGIMVAQSKASAAMDAMTAASVKITGVRLPISLKS